MPHLFLAALKTIVTGQVLFQPLAPPPLSYASVVAPPHHVSTPTTVKMPHLFPQVLKSITKSRALAQPLVPWPLSYATVAALSPPLPPPSYVDRIGALENYTLGCSAHGTNSRRDLLLPLYAVVLILAFFAALLWYGETSGRKNRVELYLSKAPRNDYGAKISAAKPFPFPSQSSRRSKRHESRRKEADSPRLDYYNLYDEGIARQIESMAANRKSRRTTATRRYRSWREEEDSPRLNCYNLYDEDVARQIESMAADVGAAFANRKSKRTFPSGTYQGENMQRTPSDVISMAIATDASSESSASLSSDSRITQDVWLRPHPDDQDNLSTFDSDDQDNLLTFDSKVSQLATHPPAIEPIPQESDRHSIWESLFAIADGDSQGRRHSIRESPFAAAGWNAKGVGRWHRR